MDRWVNRRVEKGKIGRKERRNHWREGKKGINEGRKEIKKNTAKCVQCVSAAYLQVRHCTFFIYFS